MSIIAWIRRRWLLALAGVASAAEFAVSMGVPLPLLDQIPAWLRGLIYGAIAGGGFVLRTLATRRSDRGQGR